MEDPRGVVPKPRRDAGLGLVTEADRNLLGFLLQCEAPIRATTAREQVGLSVARFGLAIRSLERHGLAQRRIMIAEGDEKRQQFAHLEATDLGREFTLTMQAPPPTA